MIFHRSECQHSKTYGESLMLASYHYSKLWSYKVIKVDVCGRLILANMVTYNVNYVFINFLNYAICCKLLPIHFSRACMYVWLKVMEKDCKSNFWVLYSILCFICLNTLYQCSDISSNSKLILSLDFTWCFSLSYFSHILVAIVNVIQWYVN